MKAFKCKKCKQICYSSADINQQINPLCPYCGAKLQKAALPPAKANDGGELCEDKIP